MPTSAFPGPVVAERHYLCQRVSVEGLVEVDGYSRGHGSFLGMRICGKRPGSDSFQASFVRREPGC